MHLDCNYLKKLERMVWNWKKSSDSPKIGPSPRSACFPQSHSHPNPRWILIPPTLVFLTSTSESVQPTPAGSCTVTQNQLCRVLPPAFLLDSPLCLGSVSKGQNQRGWGTAQSTRAVPARLVLNSWHISGEKRWQRKIRVSWRCPRTVQLILLANSYSQEDKQGNFQLPF